MVTENGRACQRIVDDARYRRGLPRLEVSQPFGLLVLVGIEAGLLVGGRRFDPAQLHESTSEFFQLGLKAGLG